MGAQVRCLGHTWYPLCDAGCCRECVTCGDRAGGAHVERVDIRLGRLDGWHARPLRLTRRGEHLLVTGLLLTLLVALAAGRPDRGRRMNPLLSDLIAVLLGVAAGTGLALTLCLAFGGWRGSRR